MDDVEKVLQCAKLLMTIDREQQEQVATVQQEGRLSEVERASDNRLLAFQSRLQP